MTSSGMWADSPINVMNISVWGEDQLLPTNRVLTVQPHPEVSFVCICVQIWPQFSGPPRCNTECLLPHVGDELLVRAQGPADKIKHVVSYISC